MSESYTIGVTGAGGYIGSKVAAKIQAEGHTVVPVDNFSNSKVNSINGQNIACLDVCDRSKLRTQFSEVDAVAHLAAITGIPDCNSDPERAFDVNVRGTENVAWICRERELPLVFAGSVAALGSPVEFPVTAAHPRNPENFYGQTKLMNEHDIQTLSEESFPSLILLQSNLYGYHGINDTRVSKDVVTNIFVDKAINGDPLTVHLPGTQAFDFIHVKDVASAYLQSIESLFRRNPGAETLVLGSGECMTVEDVAKRVQKVAQRKHGLQVEIDYVENPRGENATEADDFTIDTTNAAESIGFKSNYTMDDSIEQIFNEQT